MTEIKDTDNKIIDYHFFIISSSSLFLFASKSTIGYN